MTDIYSPNFAWSVLNELPVQKVAIVFPRDAKDSSKFYVVQITTKSGLDWVGNFRGVDHKYLSGTFLWPDLRRLCVVAGGKAYVVQADNPDVYDELPVMPIIDMYNVVERDILLFATFSEITAFNKTGLSWKTTNLANDGIKISGVRNGVIYGVANRYEGDYEFGVDLGTGQTIRLTPL